MSENLDDFNSIDAWAAVKKMKEELGWKLLMHKYAEEGNGIMDKLLEIEPKDENGNVIASGVLYTKRDLYVFQLDALSRIGKVMNEFEMEAKAALAKNKEKPHVGN